MRTGTLLFSYAIFFALLLAVATHAQEDAQEDESGNIWVIGIDDAIGPATSDHVVRGIEGAAEAGASLIVLTMNTPGGLDAAMRDIIQAILASEVPVVSYISPKGARAASAGTYISYASHIAAMAPATNLGAATPVQIGTPSLPKPSAPNKEEEGEESEQAKSEGKGLTAMEKKMINDAAAYIIGLAELRGRNAEWAEQAVREAVSLNAEAALEADVIDLIAEDLDDLLEQIDGMTVAMNGGSAQLDLADRSIYEFTPDLRTEILSVITNPSVVLILGMIGIYGIILEFYNPGALVPGVVGVICLLLAGYAMQLLPLDYAGLALILVGLGLMVAEAMAPSFGILGTGGVIAFCLGGLMLFDSELEAFQVGLPAILATGVVSALLIIATVGIALKVRRKRVTTGTSVLIGQTGEALSDFGKEDGLATQGQVRVGGEIWRCRSSDTIKEGDLVTVAAIDGLLLTVSNQADAQHS